MRRIKSSGKFSILAVLLVLSLLMTTSLVFAVQDGDPGSGSGEGTSTLSAGECDVITGTRCEITKLVEGAVPDDLDPFEFDLLDNSDDSKVDDFTLSAGATKTFTTLDEGQYYLEETNQGDWDVDYNYPNGNDYFEVTEGVIGITATFTNGGGPLSDDSDNPSATYEIYYSERNFNLNHDLGDSDVQRIYGPEPILPDMFSGANGLVSYSYPADTNTPLPAGYYGFIIKHHLDRTGEDANKQFPIGDDEEGNSFKIEESDVLNPVSFDVVNTFADENTPKAYLQVVKNSDADMPDGGFDYTITGDGVDLSGSITGTGDVLDEPIEVAPGAWYTITENVPESSGWSNSFSAENALSTVDNPGGRNGISVKIPEDLSRNVTVTVTITNTYEEEYTNRVIIKKFIDEAGGSTSMTEFPVQLWYDNDGTWVLLNDLKPNPFDVEVYDEDNAYLIENLPAGHYKLQELVDEVEAEDSDFDSVRYAVLGPDGYVSVEGTGNGAYVEFFIYDSLVPTYMTLTQVVTDLPNPEIIEVSITNKFDEGYTPPSYPDLIIEKEIGTGSTNQDYFTVALQKQEIYEQVAALNLDGGWYTIDTYSVPKNDSISFDIEDLVAEYGPGNYRVIELVDEDNIDDWSKFKSVSLDVDGGSRISYTDKNASAPFASASFMLHEELEDDVVVTVTNNFESGGGSDPDYPDLIIKKVIGAGSATQNSFTVDLQIWEDGSWNTLHTYTIPKNDSKRVSLKNFEAGDYRIIETGTDDIEDLISFSYKVDGTAYESEAPFEVVKGSSRNITVTVTNNFGDEEIITYDEPEPSTPEIITVPIQLPELPKTGAAAPLAGGLGLLLAAGGLAIRRIKK